MLTSRQTQGFPQPRPSIGHEVGFAKLIHPDSLVGASKELSYLVRRLSF